VVTSKALQTEVPPSRVGSRTMRVHILGIVHKLAKGLGNKPAEMAAHARYTALLKEIINSRGVQFIGEEEVEVYTDEGIPGVVEPCERHQEPSIAAKLGDGCCNYGMIEMTEKMQQAIGIWEEQHPRAMGQTDGRLLSDDIREAYMVFRALKLAGNAQSILVICGFEHVPHLYRKFVDLGHQVTKDSIRDHAEIGWPA
jgi:hypothetical protein